MSQSKEGPQSELFTPNFIIACAHLAVTLDTLRDPERDPHSIPWETLMINVNRLYADVQAFAEIWEDLRRRCKSVKREVMERAVCEMAKQNDHLRVLVVDNNDGGGVSSSAT